VLPFWSFLGVTFAYAVKPGGGTPLRYRISAMSTVFSPKIQKDEAGKSQQRRGSSPRSQARITRVALSVGLLTAVATQSSIAAPSSKSPSSAGKTPVTSRPKAPSDATPSKNAAKTTPLLPGSLPGTAKSAVAAKVVPLKSLSARIAVTGWDGIGSTSWPDAGDSVIAQAKGDWLDVYRNPADPNTSLRLIKGRSVAGPVVLMAVGAAGDFVRVAIPLRPNGTLGWARRSDVTLIRSTFRVEIDLSTNTMTVFDGDKVSLRAPVAAGTGGTPTPRGLFFLKEVVPQVPGGALGPFAFGLSGFSDVLTSFGGGEGVIGIHGTNAPGKLGSNVSHGCVRVDNVTITKMVRLLPLGTPVEIIESAKAARPTRASSAWLDTLLSSASAPAVAAPLPLATDPSALPVVLLAEPVGSGQPTASALPSAATAATAATATTTSTVLATTLPASPSSPTLPANDDPLGAVTAR
jgi:L,D-transpeptidase catalytic domain